MAEGGTEYSHHITIQRSESIWGPYVPCPHNPVLSNGNQWSYEIQAVGHGDLVCDQNGNWWCVCLGIRPLHPTMLHTLGRETCLVPVIWRDGWPVMGGQGHVYPETEATLPGKPEQEILYFTDDFTGQRKPEWTMIRNHPAEDFQQEEGTLWIRGNGESLDSLTGSPSWLGIRQPEYRMEAQVQVLLQEDATGGLSVYYNGEHHYEILMRKKNGEVQIVLNRQIFDLEAVTGSRTLRTEEPVSLCIKADREQYTFYCRDGERWECLGSGSTAAMATEITRTMTFTGTFVGLYAIKGKAGFRNFRMEWVREEKKSKK